jgi:hypothetical protein
MHSWRISGTRLYKTPLLHANFLFYQFGSGVYDALHIEDGDPEHANAAIK